MIKTLVTSLLLVLCAFVMVPTAKAYYTPACRDCGFPMRVGTDRWQMSNGYVELEIKTRRLPNKREKVYVRLIDTRDGSILATGVTRQKQGSKVIDVEMTDLSGEAVQGHMRFTDDHRQELAVRFTCNTCSIAGELH